jgi:tryptophan-rich sensory protein
MLVRKKVTMSILMLILASFMYVFMIVINGLANTLPLNGISTGAVSFQYPNLFQPSGITFSIWGIIYLLMFFYLITQFVNYRNKQHNNHNQLYTRINLFFSASSLLNILWLIAWHYDKIMLSTVIMIVLLVVLILLAKITQKTDMLTRMTFSVYLGWITVATIANITIMLVQIGMPNFTSLAVTLTVIILIIGLIISYLWISREKDIAFGIVIIWAYLGIFIRHLNQENLTQRYLIIYITVGVGIIFLILVNIYTVLNTNTRTKIS